MCAFCVFVLFSVPRDAGGACSGIEEAGGLRGGVSGCWAVIEQGAARGGQGGTKKRQVAAIRGITWKKEFVER